MRKNPLKTRIANGQPCRGLWLLLPSPFAVRSLSRLPLDFLAVDAEHSPLDRMTMSQMVGVIADSGGPVPVVRLAQASSENIKQALDAGAYGIIAPMINTAEEAAQVVKWARYPPVGERSYGSAYAGLSFSDSQSDYLREANEQILIAVQIESRAGLNNLDAIMNVPGVDMIFVGPVDLSISLGLDPLPENPHPVFQEALTKIKTAAQAKGMPLAIFCSDGAAAADRIREGFALVSIATDQGLLLKSAQVAIAAAGG